MHKIRSVVKIHGGKSYLLPFLFQYFPENIKNLDFYDVFGGAGTVVLNKEPSRSDSYNDIDPNLSNLLSHLGDAKFVEKINELEYSLETFEYYKNLETDDVVERAVKELVVRRMSRGGMGKNFSYSKRLRGGRPGDVNAFDTWRKYHLPSAAERFKQVKILNVQAVELISEYDGEDSLFYCDPPYLHATRTATNVYKHEMTDKQHVELGERLNNIKGKAMVSGYDCSLYNKLFAGWNRYFKLVPNHSAQGKAKQTRLECLWANY